MTVTATQPQLGLSSRLVNGVLAIKPLASFAKNRARNMMIKRAEAIGVPWRENVQRLSDRNWDAELTAVENRELKYPDYYTTSFHAYEEGNLSWKAAWEVESAAYAVHAKIWSTGDPSGDPMLRQSYHQVMEQKLDITPATILDLGCGVGMSTFALQEIYPQAQVTGLDLSPYFLAVAQYRGQQNQKNINWVHAAAESTGLADASFDLVSACLMFHELPATAAQDIITEARRLLRPGGYLAIMDMNPQSEIFLKMPPYILTLLKSTEPYLDQYFALDMKQVFSQAGLTIPSITVNSPRHRTIIAQAD
ncbi:class I SAM-dependent methyltransferase [Pleurocapsa sp. PCC 7319]|uniref:class I SAM-dependent methyltransferase n=1 Tax=Pleurocapsa sp. PCC 7319 TaxID=118161 RepID=UPI00034C4A7B|nr:class I SAM-dependent methyltransferase [Pleurocapsa sp. PCC 7319]